MATVYNKTTHAIIESANTPDYDPSEWLINPDLSGVAGVPQRYRKLVGDVPTEMTQAEKDAVDAAALVASRAAAVAQLEQAEDVLRAFMLLVLDELNAHAAKTNAILTGVENATTLANVKTAVAAIADYPTRTEQQLRTAIHAKLGT